MEATEIHFEVVRPYVCPANLCEMRKQKSETSYPILRDKRFQEITNETWIQSQKMESAKLNDEKRWKADEVFPC